MCESVNVIATKLVQIFVCVGGVNNLPDSSLSMKESL